MSAALLAATAASAGIAACAIRPPREHDHGTDVPAATPTAIDPHAGHAGHGTPAPAATPSGYAPVSIDPARAAGLALATAKVEERAFEKALRTSGVVAVDETRTAHVHPKVRGFIEGIRASFVGQKVKAGEPLCSLYSQEVYAAEMEFVAVLERLRALPAQDEQQLVAAARRRLGLWDVPRAEIARLEATREPQKTFALVAPRSGVIVSKQATQGTYVDPSTELYVISDLSKVWVLADVYESDVPHVRIGDHAELAIEGVADTLHARITFLPPSLDEATRTLKARFEIDNVGGQLRPGAFVSVTMRLPLGNGLGVPESAVIRTGTRAIVFVVHGGQHAVAREVKLGPLVGGQYRVDAGLSAGEDVAVSAQFLLDSESRLRATSSPGSGHVH